MRMSGSEDLDDTRQCSVSACTHIHGLNGQPDGINTNHRNHSRSHTAQAALSCSGHFTTIVALTRVTSTRMSGVGSGSGAMRISGMMLTARKPDGGSCIAGIMALRSLTRHRCTTLALSPFNRAIVAHRRAWLAARLQHLRSQLGAVFAPRRSLDDAIYCVHIIHVDTQCLLPHTNSI